MNSIHRVYEEAAIYIDEGQVEVPDRHSETNCAVTITITNSGGNNLAISVPERPAMSISQLPPNIPKVFPGVSYVVLQQAKEGMPVNASIKIRF